MSKIYKTKNNKVKAQMSMALAKGETHESIAKKHGVARTTVTRLAKIEEDTVLRMRERIFNENFDTMADTIRDSVSLSQVLTQGFSEDDKTITAAKVALKLGIDKTVTNPLLARVGVHNSPVINQMNIDNSINVHQNIDPAVMKMIGAGFGADIEPLQMHEAEAEVMEVE